MARRLLDGIKRHVTLFKEGVKDFRSVGTLVESSSFTIRKALAQIPFKDASLLLELGAGTGCFTKAMLLEMKHEASLVSIERHEKFMPALHAISDSRLRVIIDSAENMRQHVPTGRHVDAVVSGVPLWLLPAAARERIVSETSSLLSPKGVYVQIGCYASLRPYFQKYFDDVSMERVLLNFPPLYIYICRRPRK